MQNELDAFNLERDVVHMVTSARIVENRLVQLEQRVTENEMNTQNLALNNSGRVSHRERRREFVQDTNEVLGYPMFVKTSNFMTTSTPNSNSLSNTQEKGQSKFAVENPNRIDDSLCQILENSQEKRQYRDEAKSIDDIIDNEMQSVKNGLDSESIAVHNKKPGFEGGKSDNKIIEPKKVWDTNG